MTIWNIYLITINPLLVESSEIDNVCYRKMKKKYQTLWWTVDHFLIVFHLLHGLYISIDEYRTDGIPHIFIHRVTLILASISRQHIQPGHSSFIFSRTADHSTKLKFFFPIRSIFSQLFNQKKKKHGSESDFIITYESFFFSYVCTGN